MKISVISLLLVVLAVSWAAAAPYPDPQPHDLDSEGELDDDFEEDDYVRKKRQLSGGYNVNRTPFGRDYSANLGYNHVFNKGRTSVGVHAHKNWGASGKNGWCSGLLESNDAYRYSVDAHQGIKLDETLGIDMLSHYKFPQKMTKTCLRRCRFPGQQI